jgi:predicted  nucleic acid-binding Zn-ribbon protein
MELDARLILTISGMLVSVVSAAVIVRTKLAAVIEQLSDIEARFRALDQRVDKSELTDQRVDVLSKMLAPERREILHRSMATMETRLDNAENEISHLRTMHNHRHPPVPSP